MFLHYENFLYIYFVNKTIFYVLLTQFKKKLTLQKILIYIGLIILAIGLLWPLLKELPIGRMPGDIIILKDRFSFYFPIITCLVVSLIISIIFKFFK